MAELVAVILWSDGNELSQNALRDLTSTLHAAVKPKKKKDNLRSDFYLGDLENVLLHTLLRYKISLLLKCWLWNFIFLLEMYFSVLKEMRNGNKMPKQ